MSKWLKNLFKPKSEVKDLIKEIKKNAVVTKASEVFFNGKRLGYLQGVSFDTRKGIGDMNVIVFPDENTGRIRKDLFAGPQRLFIKACNQNKDIDVLFDGIVQFAKEKHRRVSTNDLVIDKTYQFIIEDK